MIGPVYKYPGVLAHSINWNLAMLQGFQILVILIIISKKNLLGEMSFRRKNMFGHHVEDPLGGITAVDIYAPITDSLRLVGLMPGLSGKVTPPVNQWMFCEGPWSWHSMAYFLQHFYAVHFAFRCFFRVGEEDFWPTVVEFVRVIVSLITVHVFTSRNYEYHKIIRDLDKVQGSLVENKKMSVVIRRALVLCSLYLLVRIVLDVMKVLAPINSGQELRTNHTGVFDSEVIGDKISGRLEHYAESYWYGSDLKDMGRVEKGFLAFVGTIDMITSRLLVTGSFAFTMVCCANLAHHLRVKYDYLNDSLSQRLPDSVRCYNAGVKTTSDFTSKDLMDLRRKYALLAENVSLMDSVFDKCIFMWSFAFISGFCANMTAIITEVGSTKVKKVADDPIVEMNVSLDSFYLLFWFSFVCWLGSRLHEASTASIRVLHHLTSLAPLDDVDFALQARLLLAQLNHVKVGLTSGKLFVINRAAILTIMGALITYLVVVIQMNPLAVRVLLEVTTSEGNGTIDH